MRRLFGTDWEVASVQAISFHLHVPAGGLVELGDVPWLGEDGINDKAQRVVASGPWSHGEDGVEFVLDRERRGGAFTFQ